MLVVVMPSHLVVLSSEIIASFHVKDTEYLYFSKQNSHVAISYRSIPFPSNIIYVGNEPSASSIHLPFIKMGLFEKFFYVKHCKTCQKRLTVLKKEATFGNKEGCSFRGNGHCFRKALA